MAHIQINTWGFKNLGLNFFLLSDMPKVLVHKHLKFVCVIFIKNLWKIINNGKNFSH